MTYTLNLNNRAFKAIKQGLKRIEIRATKLGDQQFDYAVIKVNDYVHFISYDKEEITCLVKEVNWYPTIEELLMLEGTRYTLSSTNDYHEGIKSINSIPGYFEAIKVNGVYALHLEYLSES